MANLPPGPKTSTDSLGALSIAAPDGSVFKIGARAETMRRVRIAERSGVFPYPMASASNITVTGDWTPSAVVDANAVEQILTINVGTMQVGDIPTSLTVPSGTSLPAGLAIAGYRYLTPTTLAVLFKNTSGASVTPPAGTWTLTVGRFTGGLPADAPAVTLLANGTTASTIGASGVIKTLSPVVGVATPTAVRLRHPVASTTGYSSLGTVVQSGQNSTTGATRSGSLMAAEWVTDAPKFEIITVGNGAGVQIIVDGKVVLPVPIVPNNLFSGQRVVVDFTQGGAQPSYNVRKLRRIRVEVGAFGYFGGITMLNTDTVSTPTNSNGLKALLFGDSFVEGQIPMHPLRWNLVNKFDGFANRLGDRMGWDESVVCGVGGTGYLATNGTSGGNPVALTYRQRLTDITGPLDANGLATGLTMNGVAGWIPDVVLIFGSLNDWAGGTQTAAVQAEAVLFHTALTKALPNSVIFVVGVQSVNNANNTLWAPLNTAIKNAVASVGAPNEFFIDMMATPWVTGTGYFNTPTNTSSQTGAGNSDWVTQGPIILSNGNPSNDNTHPTKLGHEYLVYKLSETISNIVKAYLS